jgi:hypothetical protein
MKKSIASFIAGAIIFSTVGVYAAGGNMIEVFYNVKDIKINMVSNMPEQKPFIYNGTTYVPLRYVADSLGQDVGWDGKTQTIFIGEKLTESAVYPGNGIDYMGYQENDHNAHFYYSYEGNYEKEDNYYNGVSRKIKDNVNSEYDKYIVLYHESYGSSDRSNHIDFPLNGQYKTFKAKIGLLGDTKDTTNEGTLEIIADDKVMETIDIKAGSFPEEVSVDLTGVNKITFKFYSVNTTSIGVGLFNAYFIKK